MLSKVIRVGGNGPTKVVLKYEPTSVAGQVEFTLTGELNERSYTYSWTAKADGYPVQGRASVQGVDSSARRLTTTSPSVITMGRR